MAGHSQFPIRVDPVVTLPLSYTAEYKSSGHPLYRYCAAEEALAEAAKEAACAQLSEAAAGAEREALHAQLEQLQRQHHVDCVVRPPICRLICAAKPAKLGS